MQEQKDLIDKKFAAIVEAVDQANTWNVGRDNDGARRANCYM